MTPMPKVFQFNNRLGDDVVPNKENDCQNHGSWGKITQKFLKLLTIKWLARELKSAKKHYWPQGREKAGKTYERSKVDLPAFPFVNQIDIFKVCRSWIILFFFFFSILFFSFVFHILFFSTSFESVAGIINSLRTTKTVIGCSCGYNAKNFLTNSGLSAT